jgi:anti-sigma factor RsiW
MQHRGTKHAVALQPRPRERRCKEMFAELSNYLDDELDDSLCEELEKHLDGCKPCQAFLTSLEKSIEQCRTAPKESPDPHRAARVRREVLSDYTSLMTQITKQRANQANPS